MNQNHGATAPQIPPDLLFNFCFGSIPLHLPHGHIQVAGKGLE